MGFNSAFKGLNGYKYGLYVADNSDVSELLRQGITTYARVV